MSDAWIGAIATVISAIITVLFTELLSRIRYTSPGNTRRKEVKGNWSGTFDQHLDGVLQTFELDLELKVSIFGSISGIAKLTYNGKLLRMKVNGGFYLRDFLKMNYRNANKAITQFGAFIFRLSDGCDKLEGHFVGYGHLSKKVISGPAVLIKIKD
jgi:hypothetical protein